MTPEPPRLAHLVDLRVELGPPMELSDGRAGRRRIIPIVGGTVSGRFRGRIIDHGADWQTVFADGLAEIDTRYAIETEDGALIEIRNFGYRHGPPEVLARLAAGEDVDPALYYMRTHPRFETGAPAYRHLNRMICIGTGAREATAVRMHIYEVL
ncbi:DUF3237 domain-containing protein [Acuticoccus kandeliae]|uniref:DUF3237 domain-containing protein n=1 Tax=Acuticoccus kandeliae TaxID=2073160 RepID=UPI000D3E6BD9|nr:DUF3237 domain-containing protein [Acuticoccus kandeliae]